MFEFFKKAWNIEVQRWNLFLDYWYVWLIIFIILGIIGYVYLKD